MLLSVFNWKTLDYDYYDTPETPDYGGWYELQGLGIGGTGESKTGVGVDIEDALPSLPANATFAGTGPVARGRICIRRDNKHRGEPRADHHGASLGAVFPSSRLVNLQTLPPHARVKFHQSWDQRNLDYSGANLLKVPALDEQPQSLQGYPAYSVERASLGNSTAETQASHPRELPLALFIVPVLAGSLAGYFAASRSEGLSAKWASLLGFLGGIGAGIALGREYEGYKMSTINAIASQKQQSQAEEPTAAGQNKK
jgi:hypothetical protein